MPIGLGTNFFVAKDANIDVALTDKDGNATLIRCTAAELPTGAGYAVGCIAEEDTVGTFYTNTGTVDTASFSLISASSVTVPTDLTDASTTTGRGLSVSADAITTGSIIKAINGNTTNFTTGASALWAELGAAVAGNGLKVTTSAAYTGTGLAILTAGAMTTGVGLQVTSTTGLTSGSLIRVTTSTAGALATNGVVSIRGTGDYTSNTAGLLDVLASASTAGTVVKIDADASTTGKALHLIGTGVYTGTGFVTFTQSGLTTGVGMLMTLGGITTGTGISMVLNGAGQTTHSALRIVQSTTTTGYTGALVTLTSSSTTGASQGVLLTMVNTTAGDGIKIVSNAMTLGAATCINLSHTTSVLGAGTSMLRISSTGVDTGTTTGTLLDLSQTAADGNVAVLLTDASADVSARTGIKLNYTNAAAVGAIPIEVQNAAVTGANSKFKKIGKFGTVTLYVGIDAGGNAGEGQLTGVAGDVLFNGGSNKIEYCDADGTNWTPFAV